MRSLLAGFTIRGTSFLAAGTAAVLAGLLLGERDLISVGALLMALPLLAALAASRARYRLSCARTITPPRVPAGQTALANLRLENVSRLPTGLPARRGHGAVRTRHPSQVRPERDRAGRRPGAQLSAAVRPAREIRDRPAGNPHRRCVRPGRSRAIILVPDSLRGHAKSRGATEDSCRRELAGRRRRQPDARRRRQGKTT